MYPLFYIPPYNNGVKLQTIVPMSPKTHILAANSYELEIIRLLYLLSPDNQNIQHMMQKTVKRLKTTCFAYKNCHVGECFHAALISLRFLATVSEDIEWIQNLNTLFKCHIRDTRRHSGVMWYYWLCLSELPIVVAQPEICRYKDQILKQLGRKFKMNSESNKTLNPVLLCIARNALSRLPEYAYIKDRQPYVNLKDEYLYFNMENN